MGQGAVKLKAIEDGIVGTIHAVGPETTIFDVSSPEENFHYLTAIRRACKEYLGEDRKVSERLKEFNALSAEKKKGSLTANFLFACYGRENPEVPFALAVIQTETARQILSFETPPDDVEDIESAWLDTELQYPQERGLSNPEMVQKICDRFPAITPERIQNVLKPWDGLVRRCP